MGGGTKFSLVRLGVMVSHTPIEVETLGKLQASNDWVDLGRHFIPAPQRLYTWWSYRAADWQAVNKGRRLDHIWVTPALKQRVAGVEVFTDVRHWRPASDHVPVMLKLHRIPASESLESDP